jgi:hypothetical protein
MEPNEASERIKKIEKLLYESLDVYNDTIIEYYSIGDFGRDLENVGNAVVDTANVVGDAVVDVAKQAEEAVSKFVEGMSGQDIWNVIKPVVEPIITTMINGVVNPLKTTINNSIIDKFNSALTTVVSEIETATNKTVGGLNSGLSGFFDILKTISNFINETTARFIKMGDGLNEIFTGLFETEVKGLGDGLNKGFTNIGELLKYSGEFIFSYITCGVQYIQNLHRCLLFYCLDAFGQIMYMPVRLLLWFMKTFLFRDMYSLENMAWDYLEKADQYFYQYTGVHISHYPKNIRDSCYNCKRMKVNALKGKVKEINYDFNKRMPALLQAGVTQMQDGSKTFAGAFNSDFQIPADFKNPIDTNTLKAPTIGEAKFAVNNAIPHI